jgi:histidine kinase
MSLMNSLRNVSVKKRITLWYTIFLFTILALVLMFLYYFSENFMFNNTKVNLRNTTKKVIEEYIEDNNFTSFENGVYFSKYDSKKKFILGRMLFLGNEDFIDKGEKTVSQETGSFMYIDNYIKNTDEWIRGAISIQYDELYMKSFLRNIIIIFSVSIIVIAVGGFLITRDAFKPIKKMITIANDISQNMDLSKRINIDKGKDEFNQFALVLNRMLNEVEKSYKREKQFTSDVSHELRTPLSVILAEAEYINHYNLTKEEMKESVEVIERQSKQMTQLVNSLLEISRLDNMKMIEKSKYNLSKSFLTRLSDNRLIIENAGKKLNVDIEDNIFYFGNESLMNRVIDNILSNAIRFARNDISVTMYKDESICISIKDDGIGIKKEELYKIWERFYQSDVSRARSDYKGAGLGLSYVSSILKMHDAKVEVKSEYGKYAEFIIYL